MVEFQTVWGWPAAIYLFLSGLGSGVFVAATLLFFSDRKQFRKTILASYWIATICLFLGLMLLLFEVTKPQNAIIVWRSFSGRSWMAYGAWGLLASLIVFASSACLATKGLVRILNQIWAALSRLKHGARKALSATGLVLALFVAIYTGLLLASAPGIPLWNTWSLPCLFAVSALDAGLNTVALIAIVTRDAGKMSRFKRRRFAVVVMTLVAVETLVLCCFIHIALQGGAGESLAQSYGMAFSAQEFLSGRLSGLFWCLVVICGLAVPFTLSAVSLFTRKKVGFVLISIGAIGALLGEFALRYTILFAGAHVDYLGFALINLL